MNILITGGSGFIGSHLTEYHLLKNDRVTVIDNLSTGKEENLTKFRKNSNLKVFFEDIFQLDKRTFQELIQEADCIYHLVSVVGVFKVLSNPRATLQTSINSCDYLFKLLESSNKKPKVIITSSSEVYGINSDETLNEDSQSIILPNFSRFSYCVGKIGEEMIALYYAKKFAIPLTVVRLFNTIGERQSGQYGMVVPRFIEQAMEGKPITVFGNGKQTRCFCDVHDAVRALDLLAQKTNLTPAIYNVGLDESTTIIALAKLVKELSGSPSEIVFQKYEEVYEPGYMSVLHRKPNIKKLISLGFQHQWDLIRTLNHLIQIKKSSIENK